MKDCEAWLGIWIHPVGLGEQMTFRRAENQVMKLRSERGLATEQMGAEQIGGRNQRKL